MDIIKSRLQRSEQHYQEAQSLIYDCIRNQLDSSWKESYIEAIECLKLAEDLGHVKTIEIAKFHSLGLHRRYVLYLFMYTDTEDLINRIFELNNLILYVSKIEEQWFFHTLNCIGANMKFKTTKETNELAKSIETRCQQKDIKDIFGYVLYRICSELCDENNTIDYLRIISKEAQYLHRLPHDIHSFKDEYLNMILQEIEETQKLLITRLTDAERKIEELEIKIAYQPGGTGYLKTKEHFESIQSTH